MIQLCTDCLVTSLIKESLSNKRVVSMDTKEGVLAKTGRMVADVHINFKQKGHEPVNALI